MSDYNKITDYSAKDALSSGDSVKRVKGSEIGADFDAVAVAVATKANSASPVFTGVSSFAVGAVGAPSIYMTGYATTGWYNIGANNWGFAVSGAKVLDIASTGLAVTGTLSATGAITETTGAAWTAYTPTISAETGSFTGQTIHSARYRVLGKTLFISISVSSTGVTGAPTQIRITAPGAQTYGTSAQNIACPIISGGTAEIGTVRAYDVLGFIVERCGATAFTGATAATFNGVFETQ